MNAQTGVMTFSVAGSCTVQVTATPVNVHYTGTATASESFVVTSPVVAQAPVVTIAVTISIPHTTASVTVDQSYVVTATSNDFTANYTFVVTDGNTSCTVSPTSGSVTFLAAGTCTVTASAIATSSPYVGTASASEVFTVLPVAVPTVSLSFSLGIGHGIVPASISVLSGSSATLPSLSGVATAKGKKFQGWEIGSSVYSAGAMVAVSSNETATAQWAAVKTSVKRTGLHFALGATVLTPSQKLQLQLLAKKIEAAGAHTVSVSGSASAIGAAALNKTLAAQRAQNVATYLRSLLKQYGITVRTTSSVGSASSSAQSVTITVS